MTVSIHEVETHLSRFLMEVEMGEEVFIARAGKVIAKLSSVEPPRSEPGAWKPTVLMAPDFDAPDPALEALFVAEPSPEL